MYIHNIVGDPQAASSCLFIRSSPLLPFKLALIYLHDGAKTNLSRDIAYTYHPLLHESMAKQARSLGPECKDANAHSFQLVSTTQFEY